MLVGLLPSWLLWSLAGVSAGLAAWLWTRQARTGTLTAALCAVLFAGFTTPMMRSLASGQEADYRLLSGAAGGVMRGDSFEQIIADNMDALTDGLERRLPELVSRAPQRDYPKKGKKAFEGYKVVGNLAPGGSGALLYLAKPLPAKLAEFENRNLPLPDKVVIKSFDVAEGSTLPQILRESRALECARNLGLVLEHNLASNSFHYVMPYVPGDGLDTVIRRLHARSTGDGLTDAALKQVVSYSTDLLRTLERFHAGGLWHKDIKPSNLIVSEDRVHLVDLGLVTPLESAMTLTTHGTEYFRDPELVRMALRGVKVHEVDGVKFDLYSAGAVLYAMIEDSFPAHGSLSALHKRCPDALRWIVRRAMSDLNTRYGSANEMLMDLIALQKSSDPFAFVPADLPSMQSGANPIDSRRFDVPDPMEAAAKPAASYHTADPAKAPSSSPTPEPEPVPPAAATPPRRPSGYDPDKRVPYVPDPVRAARRQRRRKTARRVAAAMLFAFIGLTMMGGLATLARSRRFHSVTYERHAQSQAAAPQVNRTQDSRELFADLAHRLPEIEPNEPDGNVLLLEDLMLSVEPHVLEGLELALGDHGYRTIGASLSEEQDEREILLIAGARNAVGLSSPDEPAAIKRLQEFLMETRALDGIVWLAPGENDDELNYRLIGRETPFSESAQLSGVRSARMYVVR